MTAPSFPRTTALLAISGLALFPPRSLAVDPPHPGGCATCHVVHGGFDTYATDLNCLSCHFAGGPGAEMGRHTPVGSAMGIRCAVCHDAHAQQPIVGKYLRDALPFPDPLSPRTVDYAGGGLDALCLACHRQGTAPVGTIDWSGSKHGAASAEPLQTGDVLTGFPLLAPYADAGRGSYSLACLACHQPHAGPVPTLVRPVVNGAAVQVGADGQVVFASLCNACHQASRDRHHVPDVSAKLGFTSPSCVTCHPLVWNPATNGYDVQMNACATTSCHAHGSYF